MPGYVPPHKRECATSPPWTSLESLISPDDSVSVVAGRSTTPLVELNEGDVACVLHSLGLGRYADACMVVPLRGRDLAHCTDDDLKEIGIRFRPHRLSLLEEVAGLRANGVPTHMLLEPPSQQQHSQPLSALVHSPPPTVPPAPPPVPPTGSVVGAVWRKRYCGARLPQQTAVRSWPRSSELVLARTSPPAPLAAPG